MYRVYVYASYALLTLIAFAVAEFHPNSLTEAMPANLLAGLLVVVFVDSIMRLGEARRLRPVHIITQRINSIARARLKSLFRTVHRTAVDSKLINGADYDLDLEPELPVALAGIASQIPLRHHLSTGEEFLTLLWQDQQSVMETLNKALDHYGYYQDPEIASLLSEVAHCPLMLLIAQLKPSGFAAANPRVPDHMWRDVIIWHNQLVARLDREALRLGRDPATP